MAVAEVVVEGDRRREREASLVVLARECIDGGAKRSRACEEENRTGCVFAFELSKLS